jgi:H+/Cl- antiporter ClcA
MAGESVPWILWIIKILAVTITLGMGGSGGVVTPMFFIGSIFGMNFAHLFSLNSPFWSQVGLVTFLGACANTPLSAVIMACELFGFSHAIPVILAVTVSYKLLGHRSIYPSQLLLITKSMSIDVPLGEPVVNAQAGFIPNRNIAGKRLFDSIPFRI